MPLPHRDRAATLALAGVVAAAALVACTGPDGPEPPERPGGAGQELDDLPGVGSAEVGEELVDQDQPGTVVVVDVEADITVEELGAVFVAVDDLAADQWIVSLDCAPASWEGTREQDDCDVATGSATTASGTPGHGARALLATARALPDATVRVASRRDVDVRLTTPGPAPVAAALEVVLADPTLRTVGDLTLAAAPGADSERFSVTTDEPVSAPTLALWRRLEPTLGRLPGGTPGSYSLAVDRGGRTTLAARVQLPGVVLPDQLTPQRYGAALWPLLRAQLDVLRELDDSGRGARYTAGNSYRPVADARPHGNDPFLDVTLGTPGRADALGRSWSVEGARHANRP